MRMVIAIPVIIMPFLDVNADVISSHVVNLICCPRVEKENYKFTFTNSHTKEFIAGILH
jgi:hypothetical protein